MLLPTCSSSETAATSSFRKPKEKPTNFLKRNRNMNLSASDLYPVVQDLTDFEYGCCSASEVFGSFALQDLVQPSSSSMRPLSSSGEVSPQRRKRHSRSWSFKMLDRENSLIDHANDERADEITQREQSCDRFEDTFVLTRQICSCRISTVWECVDRNTGVRHCAKVVDKRRFTSPQDEETTLYEMSMLERLKESDTRHHLLQALHISQDEHRYYIVTNLVEGGSLASFLLQERMTEEKVRLFAKALLENVAELHSLGIGHFSLNPENVLLGPDNQVCICDFGSAAFLEDLECRSRQSKLAYASPEDIKKRPDLASDLWSVGVMLYVCFCYHLPFRDSSRTKLKAKICRHSYDFSSRHWNLVSRVAKQFISNLLHPDPHIRMTAQEALNHPWLSYTIPKEKPKVQRRRRLRLVENVWGRLKRQPQIDSNELKKTSTFSSNESNE